MSRQRRSHSQARKKRKQLLDGIKTETRVAWIAGRDGHSFESFVQALRRAESMDVAVWEVVEDMIPDLDEEGHFIVAEIAAPHLLGPKGRLRGYPTL
jgi:hypothetical protein